MNDDLVKRSDAIEAMEKLIKAEGTMDYTEWDFPTSYKQERINQTEACIDQIRYVPSADRPQGEWINKHEWDNGFLERECSLCGAMKPILMHTAKINYCPNCGARMKGADNE